jgi:hypothetical protein
MYSLFLSVLSFSCAAKQDFVPQRPWEERTQPALKKDVKPIVREGETRPADEAMILVVPDSVQSVTLTTCARGRKAVRHSQVRFFDIPNKDCRVRFAPSGLFTSVIGGVGVHHCQVLENNSSVICTLSLDGLKSIPEYK